MPSYVNSMRMTVKYAFIQFKASLALVEGRWVILEGPYSHYLSLLEKVKLELEEFGVKQILESSLHQ